MCAMWVSPTSRFFASPSSVQCVSTCWYPLGGTGRINVSRVNVHFSGGVDREEQRTARVLVPSTDAAFPGWWRTAEATTGAAR